MEGGCCDQLENQSRDELNNKVPIDSSTSRQDEERSTAKDVKKSLAFGIEAILATAKHSDDQKENIVKEEKFDVKVDMEEEDSSRLSHHPINFPFSYSNYYPLTSSSSSSSSSSWSDEKRSGSTSPPLQEMRRPFLSSSSSSLSSTVSEEEKLTRPMLPFLLPHTLSLRRHRIDR